MALFKSIKKIPSVNSPNSTDKDDYFEEAQGWSEQRYQIQEVISNRWQLAFWLMIGFSLLLLIFLTLLLPLKSWEPIVIYRNTQTGEVWVQPAKDHYLPETIGEVESDLVRYVSARETYSLMDNNVRKKQVHDSSSPAVTKTYDDGQDRNNPQNLINVLGQSGVRSVKVQDVVFLDNSSNIFDKKKKEQQKMPSLAKVDFITTDIKGEITIQKYWVATLSWEYLGQPDSQDAAWLNWNGFTVTNYRVDQRNL